jgi:subtilisin-like proprotein convertase family protein
MLTLTPRSARLTARLLVCLLFCSQVGAFKLYAFQESSQVKSESLPRAKSVARKSKKRKKKKAVPQLSYSSFSLPANTAPASQVSSRIVAQKPIVSAPAPTTRTTNRSARTPGVHITPVSIRPTAAPSFSGTNSSPITIDPVNPDSDPAPAVPYSSDIDVGTLTGNITSVSVTINGLTHDSPDDLDMLLVAPNGTPFHFWSDVGGSSPVSDITVTVADTGATALPDDGPLVSGTTYRPFNEDAALDQDVSESFPNPAPAPPYNEPAPAGAATFASLFSGWTGVQAGGTWNLYVTDDTNGNGGVIAGGWTLNITTEIPPTAPGQLIISEFRTNGPFSESDEFVELYNTTGAPLIVQSSDESAGLGVAASDGVVRCIVPNGTVIPTNGHFLCANSGGKGGDFRSASGRRSIVDVFYGVDIPENAGIAIFNTSNTGPTNQTIQNRLDAVGSTSEANTLYKEGAGYPASETSNLDYSFYRDLRPSGNPKDTGDNAADFLFVETNGTSTSAGQRLGAPSPEGLTDPRTTNESVSVTLVAPCMAAPAPPNRVRSFTSDPANNSTFGTLSIRRAVTNQTEVPMTRLRFKVIDITTFPVPAGVADLRLRSSVDSSETDPCAVESGTLNISGLLLEPPSQPNGGGFNSNVSATIVDLQNPLQPGQTILVNFLFGVQQVGSFRAYVNIETLP